MQAEESGGKKHGQLLCINENVAFDDQLVILLSTLFVGTVSSRL